MQKFIEDNWFKVSLTFLIWLFVVIFMNLASETNKYRLCVETKMQYINGNCVTQENKNGK